MKITNAGVARKADAYLKALTALDRFSGSALLAQNGEIIFSKGYGFANREHNVPNTPQTKFRLASVSKQFTAMAILILEERGSLRVTDEVSKYILESPSAWKGITLRQLLNHTSGIPNYTNFIDWRTTARHSLSPLEVVEPMMKKPLDFRHGERHSYSNTGYMLLGQIIEVVSGKSYAEYLQQHIFGPLGMKNSGYD
ncbi:MAG TPA: serine hydrolase domain-containing protein, partial [Capsulimonadaceae bacterium]|nr:serine hydrolase domain-containing protein [Capsulimonadaceae bacterium]